MSRPNCPCTDSGCNATVRFDPAYEDVGAEARGNGHFRRCPAIGAGEHPFIAVRVSEHRPNDYATPGNTNVETEPCHRPSIGVIRLTRHAPKQTTHIALRTDDQPDAGRK